MLAEENEKKENEKKTKESQCFGKRGRKFTSKKRQRVVNIFRKVIYMRILSLILSFVRLPCTFRRCLFAIWMCRIIFELYIHLNLVSKMSKHNEFHLSRAHVRCQKGKVPSAMNCTSADFSCLAIHAFFSWSLLFYRNVSDVCVCFFFLPSLLLTPVPITNEDQYIFICYVFGSIEVQHYWTLHF